MFRADRGGWTYLYAPGLPVRLRRKGADRLIRIFRAGAGKEGGTPWGLAADALERAASRAAVRYEEILRTDFSPVCLTAIQSRDCPGACTYCFAGSGKGGGGLLDEETFLRAARRVGDNCRRRGKDFVLVMHGGGEPTAHMGRLKRFHALARAIARDAEVGFISHVATGGVLSEGDAAWLGGHFSSIGLSCDGPPEIQDRQRPLGGGKPTSARVARSARIMRDAGCRLSMRATITPETYEELGAIVRYGREILGVADIRAEPVYGQPGLGFTPESADRFVEAFRSAEALARGLGCSLSLSGARPLEIHGPYCQIHRDVLQLNPDGTISACFMAMSAGDPRIIGRIRPGKRTQTIRKILLAGLSKTLADVPPRCAGCVNRWHCVRDCPDRCPLEGESVPSGRPGSRPPAEGFRCRVQRRLTESWIIENARPVSSFPDGKGGLHA